MARYVSKDGVWSSAKEKVALTKNGEPYVYEGPDRAAEFEFFKAGVKTFGMDFHYDPDLINRAKQLGFKDVNEYASAMGYDKEKAEKDFKENAAFVTKHELPARKEGIEVFGGGVDKSGQGNDILGGFGKENTEKRPRK